MRKLLIKFQSIFLAISLVFSYLIFPEEVFALTAPTLVDYQQSTWTDDVATDEATPAITWQSGDVILVLGEASAGNMTLGTPTATGLIFSLVQDSNPTSDDQMSRAYAWSATAAGSGSSVVTSVAGGGLDARGISVFVYRGSGGIGNSAIEHNETNNSYISLTRGFDNSVVAVVLADWGSSGDVVVTPLPVGGTQRVAEDIGNKVTAFVFNFGDQGATGTTNYGMTDNAGSARWDGVVVEIKAGSPTTNTINIKVRGRVKIRGKVKFR
jgi:hypothetical protein